MDYCVQLSFDNVNSPGARRLRRRPRQGGRGAGLQGDPGRPARGPGVGLRAGAQADGGVPRAGARRGASSSGSRTSPWAPSWTTSSSSRSSRRWTSTPPPAIALAGLTELDRTVHVVVAPGQVQGIAHRAARWPTGSRPGSPPSRCRSVGGRARPGRGRRRRHRRRRARGRVRAGPGARARARPASRSTRRTRCATGSRWSRWPTSPGCGCCRRTGLAPLTATLLRHRARWSAAALDRGCHTRRAGHRRQRQHRRRRRDAGGARRAAARRRREPAAARRRRRWPTSTASTCPACTRPGRRHGRRGLRRRQPAARPARRRGGVRAAEGRDPGRRRARSTPRWRTGPTSSTRPPARAGCPRPAGRRAPRAGSATRAMAVLGAELEPGIGLVLDLVRFADHLPGARLVITGEGSLDEQTLHGKAPAGVAAAAARPGSRSSTVSGRLALDGATAAGGRHRRRPTRSPTSNPTSQRCLAERRPAAGTPGHERWPVTPDREARLR